MYLYKATIFKNPDWLGVPPNSHAADKADFEANFKTTALKVNEVIIAETTFSSDLTYAAFKAKIVAPLGWSDVKYIEDGLKYILTLISQTPL